MANYRAPPDERTKGLLRILVADKFSTSKIAEIAQLLEVPPSARLGGNKSDKAGNMIRALGPEKLKELVAMLFGDGYVRPSATSPENASAEAEVRAACVVSGPGDRPSVYVPSSGPSRNLFDDLQQQPGIVVVPPVPGAMRFGAPGPTITDQRGPTIVGVPPVPGSMQFGAPGPTTIDQRDPVLPGRIGPPAVFVVHGHDHGKREAVARLIERQGLEAIVLEEQPGEGKTVIEKFEKHAARVEYAVVLLTADDIGATKATPPDQLRPRARQNAILELGYFAGAIHRSKVCALLEDEVEVPSDFGGVVYVLLDAGGAWRTKLAKEMKAAGLPIDLNKL